MKNRHGRTLAKSDLPQKICPACDRPFSWRRKWARDWEQVIYCSAACRSQGKAGAGPSSARATHSPH